MPFDAFISYSSQDKMAADACCAVLESAGVRCWIAPRDIRPGAEYAAAIIDAIDRCRLMVLIFSSSANASGQIHREIERAVSKGLPIIPVRIEEVVPTKSLEYFLGAIHWLDALTPPVEKHFLQLSETVKAILKVNSSTGSAPLNEGGRQAAARRHYETASAAHASRSKKPARLKWFWATIIASLVVGLIAVGVWFYQTRVPVEKQCVGESGAKSIASNTQTAIIFYNKTAVPIMIFWLNSQALREFFYELAPGQNYRQDTYTNHVWVVTDIRGDCLGLYRAEGATTEVTIGP
jgi:TIR domain/VHL beta domain